MVTVSTSPERAAYERVRERMAKSGLNPDEFIIHQKTLRIEQAITSATVYKYNLYEVQSSQNPTEIKLNRNDAFFCYGMALNIALEDTTTPVTMANTVLQTWPDPAIFAAAGEAVALEAFYNALLTFKTVPTERIVDFATNELRFNPGAADINKYGNSQNERGYFHLSGEVIMDGKEDNSLVLSLPSNASIAAAVVAGQTNWTVVKLLGHVVQNGSKAISQFLRS